MGRPAADDGRWTMDDGGKATPPSTPSSIVHRPSSVPRPPTSASPIWRFPLGWQLSALYALLLLATLGVVGLVVYSQQETFLVQDAQQRLVTQAAHIAEIPQQGLGPSDRHSG